ncbi:MAG: lysophospholipid acyltransferase family protein [Thermoleophilia bacterium]
MATTTRPSRLYLLVGALSYPVLRTVGRLHWQGAERLPTTGGYVLAANHLSNFDPWLVGMPLFPRRYLRFMAKSELFWFPLGPFISACGAFPIRRGQHDDEAVETAFSLCREGNVVVMFPEGTRRQKGLHKRHEARWHSGAARIAIEAGVPLIPAGIHGSAKLLRFGRLRVSFGAPVPLDDLACLPLDEAVHIATERLRTAIKGLEESLV